MLIDAALGLLPASVKQHAQAWQNFASLRSDRLRFMERLAARGEPVVELPISLYHVYVLFDLDDIKEILVNQTRKVHKGMGLERAKEVLGEGLLTAEGDAHLRQRRLVQPAFHKQRLRGYGSAMIDCTTQYRSELQDGELRDMHTEMMRLTLRIVGRTLFDVDTSADADEIGQCLHNFVQSFNFTMLPFYPLLRHLPLPQVRRIHATRAALDRYIYRIIDERRKSGRDHGDLLSMLIAATDQESEGATTLSDTQLRDECLTLLLAGHETTANALTWTLFLLSQHPAVEQRLLGEIDSVLGDRLPTIDDLPRLSYCEQVVAESLRLYPPAYAIARRVLEPIDLPSGHRLQPGSLAIVPIRVIHRLPTFYPDPERFDPERFTAEAKARRPRFAYLPFSHGPRNCIGEHFAWMEAVLVLATLLQRVQFRLAPGQVVEPDPLITLRARYGMRMRVCARRPRPQAS
ncbi:MAG: cytochrome P450 [Myxococcales bacterium]|nr:cytochrome P450 [Myxococcales bacterium]